MNIFAFQGLRYRTDPILAGRRGGPPYDQIDEALWQLDFAGTDYEQRTP